MKPVLLILIFFLFILSPLFSQEVIKADTSQKQGTTDSIVEVEVKPVVIFPPVKFGSKREMVRYDKLVYNVKKVYPYAKLAGQKLKEYEKILDTIPDEKARKVFMKKAEKELETKFGDEIRDLTYSQGKILIKLIYRETGNTSFALVKELRGGFRAFIWQTLAVIFGYNLKTTYDAGGDDQAIERIVIMIEAGAI